MGGPVFPPCCLTWGQTMVEVMKIMVTSFKRSHARTATLSAPNPAAGHCWPTPALETPGHSQASLCQSLVGKLLLSSGSWCTQGFACALQEFVSPVLCKDFCILDAKVGSQETPEVTGKFPWRTKWSRTKANGVLARERTVIANTLFQQHKTRLYTWTSPGDQYQNQTDYIICSQRWRSSI